MSDNLTSLESIAAGDLRAGVENGVGRITFNRAPLNSFTFRMMADFAEVLASYNRDPNVKVILLDATGCNFCAGGDLKEAGEMLTTPAHERAKLVQRRVEIPAARIAREVERTACPIVASVRGHAIGFGFHLVVAADLVVASETAKFVFPYVNLGHPMDHGESFFLRRKVGTSRALQLMLAAETLGAAEAERLNIVNWVTADAELESRTAKLVEGFASGATLAVNALKALMRSPGASLEEHMAAENAATAITAGSDDFAEAMVAFAEKRPVRFVGR